MTPIEPKRNLLILHQPEFQAFSDWETVARKVQQRAPDIDVRILDSSLMGRVARRWQQSRPSLVFSTVGRGNYRPASGTVVLSPKIPEDDQFPRLTAAGISIPRTMRLIPGMALRPDVWGDYLILKPMAEKRGSDLRLVRTQELGPRYLALTRNGQDRMLVKRYIHSVDRGGYPIEFRVTTLFGKVLYAFRARTLEKRSSIEEFIDSNRSIHSSDSPGVKRDHELTFDEDVLQLARDAAAVFPACACLGIDILRDSASGKLFVIELNAGGAAWHFSSRHTKNFDPRFRRSLYTQFNALDVIADLLIEKTRAEAS